MKKLWVIACLFILFGCTDSNEQTETSNKKPDHVQEQKPQQDEEILITPNPTENQQLAKFLIELYKHYGVISPNHEYHDRKGDIAVGIVYADLIDFNRDGQKELYVLFKSGYLMQDGYSHRTNNGYIEEIWEIGESEPTLLWNEHYTYDESESSDLSLSLLLLKDRRTVLNHTTKQSAFTKTTFYSLQDNNFLLADEFTIQKKNNEYKLNGVSVDLQTFTDKLDQYDGVEKYLIKSNAGKKEFGFSLENPISQVSLVLDVLSADINQTLVENEGLPKTEEFIAAIKEYRHFHNIDVRDPSTYTSMIDALTLNRIVESDAEPYDYFGDGYKEETIIEAVKTYFGVELDPSSLGLPSEMTGYSWLHYVNNGFYLPASDYYREEVIAITEKIVQLSDNLYFAKVNNFYFNAMEHSIATETRFNFMEYFDVPFDEWPEHTQPYLSVRLPTYLILKKVDNRFQLLYKSNLNLTDNELLQFSTM